MLTSRQHKSTVTETVFLFDKMLNQNDFKNLKEKMRLRYDSIESPIYCKSLGQHIKLNSRGFRHLLRKGSGMPRNQADAESRLNLIPLIATILKSECDVSHETRNIKGKNVEMWGLNITIKRGLLIRLVVKSEGNGNIIFWSIRQDR